MSEPHSGSDIEARLRQVERALADLDRYETELNSGFANGLRAKDWERELEVAPVAAERAALLEERRRLLGADGAP